LNNHVNLPLQQSAEKLLRLGNQAHSILNHELAERFKHFTDGLSIYANRRPLVTITPYHDIWQKGNARILKFAPARQVTASHTTLLIIPSLINRWDIMDLHQQCSFIDYLCGKGISPMVLDWGEPGDLERTLDVRGYIEQIALPAVRWARANMPVKQRFFLGGYCMGGTIAAATSQLMGGDIDGLLLLAAPWNFNISPFNLLKADAAIIERASNNGILPHEFIQFLFYAMDPFLFHRKFEKLGRGEITGIEKEIFLGIEEWANNGVNISTKAATECMLEWASGNILQEKNWCVAGEKIMPEKIRAKTIAVIPARDRIVPPQSALALASALPDCHIISPDCGHIGISASRKAADIFWNKIVDAMAT